MSKPRYLVKDRGYATPCHVWTGALSTGGYASLRINGRTCADIHAGRTWT